MFKKIVAVSKEAHSDLKITPITSFEFARGYHVASVMGAEFFRAASTYPIVFVEDQVTDEFRPVVLLGLEPDENLFVDPSGKWEAAYIPAIIRRYPFALAKTDEDGRFTVCLDQESEFLSKDEGEPLFDEEGEPGKVLENVKKYLGGLQQMEQATQELCREFKEKNMFAPLNMRLREAEKLQNITGAYAVNEQRLGNLSDKEFLELRKKNVLPLIYSHLVSLTQVERLLKLRAQRNGQPAEEADEN